jgi:hypothetical protein
MYKTISNKIIRTFNPCYDPSKFITDENEELSIRYWIKKYRNVVPIKDIFWLLLRKEFLFEKDLRLFGVWCARESLKLIANPDERNINVCNVAERYANGKATKEELDVAYIAADDAYIAVYDVAFAAHIASHYAYYAVTAADVDYVTYCAAISAYHTATKTAYYAANDTVARADAIADRTAQVDKLLTYFE